MRLPFTVTSAGDIYQGKVYEIFKELPNAYRIAGDIFVVVCRKMMVTVKRQYDRC